MLWGEPTWFMLHTLSCKVKEEVFHKIRRELLDVIYTVCTHLPCPDCANHAKQHLDSINFNRIQTKEFHNIVNRRKGYAQFDYNELDAKYSKAITNAILKNFMHHFQDRPTRSVKMIATDLHRSLISNKMKEWFNANIHMFDP
jgi:hypothetical protein